MHNFCWCQFWWVVTTNMLKHCLCQTRQQNVVIDENAACQGWWTESSDKTNLKKRDHVGHDGRSPNHKRQTKATIPDVLHRSVPFHSTQQKVFDAIDPVCSSPLFIPFAQKMVRSGPQRSAPTIVFRYIPLVLQPGQPKTAQPANTVLSGPNRSGPQLNPFRSKTFQCVHQSRSGPKRTPVQIISVTSVPFRFWYIPAIRKWCSNKKHET
jgi:hypothetical protein